VCVLKARPPANPQPLPPQWNADIDSTANHLVVTAPRCLSRVRAVEAQKGGAQSLQCFFEVTGQCRSHQFPCLPASNPMGSCLGELIMQLVGLPWAVAQRRVRARVGNQRRGHVPLFPAPPPPRSSPPPPPSSTNAWGGLFLAVVYGYMVLRGAMLIGDGGEWLMELKLAPALIGGALRLVRHRCWRVVLWS